MGARICSEVKLADDTPEAENMPAVAETLAVPDPLEAAERATTTQDTTNSYRIDNIQELEWDPIKEQEEDLIHGEEDENDHGDDDDDEDIIQVDGLEDEGMHHDVRDAGNIRLTLKMRKDDDINSLGYTGTTIWAGVFLCGAICAVDTLLTIGTGGDSKEGVLKFDRLTDDLIVLKAGYRELTDACIDIMIRRINMAGEDPITYKMLCRSLREDARLIRLRQKRSQIAKYKHYRCSLILVSRALAALGGDKSVCLIAVTCPKISKDYFRSMGAGKGYPQAHSRLLVDYSSSYDSVLHRIEEGFSLAAEADTNTGGRVIVLAALREEGGKEGGTALGPWTHVATHPIPLPGLELTHLH